MLRPTALLAPFLLRTDFSVWPSRRLLAASLLLLSWVADVLRMWAMAQFSVVPAVGGLAWYLLLSCLPPRFGCAAGAFALVQAGVAYVLFWLCMTFIPEVQLLSLGDLATVYLAELPGYAWLFWCLFAFLVMLLHFIRLPRAQRR